MTEKYRQKALWSWVFYDFANTIFSAVVLTSFFPLYFTRLAGANWYLGAATTGSMILAAVFMPALGGLTDRTGGTKRYLLISTLGCISFLASFSFIKAIFPLLAVFYAACLLYHASLIFYNALLPVVAPPEKQGWASGLGTGLGYLGVVFSLPLASWIASAFGERWVFLLAASLFLFFSLPLFYFVPERRVKNPIPFGRSVWKEEWQKVFSLVKELPQTPWLLAFFAGNFFAVDALNTMIFWFSVYAREVFQPSQNQLLGILAAVNLSAFIMGILAGKLTDRYKALPVLTSSVISLMMTVIGLTLVPDFRGFAAVSILFGAFAIAGIWTAGRKALIDFSPPEKIGEYFGLYGLTSKISVLGNLIFSIVADGAGFKPALRVLLVPAAAGLIFLIASARLAQRRS